MDAMRARLTQAVGGAWARGYSPRALHHGVGRVLGATHAVLLTDAILREHAAAGVAATPTWDREVADLAARHGGGAVDATTMGQADELLAFLNALREEPPTITRDGVEEQVRGLDGPVLTRIRALLRKAESTDFDHEAEALTAKAQELITRHAVDEALVEGERPAGSTVARRILLDDPYLDVKGLLVTEVAAASRCSAVLARRMGWVTVFGHVTDVAACELLVTSLQAQALHGMARIGSVVDAHGRSRTRSFRRAYLMGFAVRVGERLQAAAAQVISDVDEGSGGALPVLASRAVAAEQAVAAAFPDLQQRTISPGSSSAGYVAGQTAADLASLNPASGAVLPGEGG